MTGPTLTTVASASRASTPETRNTAARLRSRLAVVLAVFAVVPLLIGAVLLALVAPAHARSAAVDAAARDGDAAAVALMARCDAVRASARIAAGEVAAFATRNGGKVTAQAAATFADRAVARRPGSAAAVFDTQARLLASTGADATRRTAIGVGAQSVGAEGPELAPSCAVGRAGTIGDGAGLAEISPVLINPADSNAKVEVASVVLWLPLDATTLTALRDQLGAQGDLGLLPADGQPVVLAGTGTAADLTALLRRLPRDGAVEGSAEGFGYRLVPAGPGLPYRVLAVDRAGGGDLRIVGWLLFALALIALVPVWLVLMRLTRPVTEELTAADGELEAGRAALADSLDRFGEVLAHTHDLNELLGTVTGTALTGTGSVAAAILLVAEEVDPPAPTVGQRGPAAPTTERRGMEPPTLGVRSETGLPNPRGDQARAALPGFAERHFTLLKATPQAFREPFLTELPGTGPVAAIGVGVDAVPVETPAERGPSRRRLIGVLVVARGEGGPAFDALQLTRLRALAAQTGTAITNIRRYLEVRRLSMTDTLTGLGNRAQLVSSLSREIAAASRGNGVLTLLMLDIDHFKMVNDTWGHGFGDIVLRDFAARLLACVREADTVARYGGEEFVVLLRDTDVDGGCRVAERVLDAARSRPFEDAEVSQPVTVSIGVAAYPRDGRTADDVLEAADSALYAAKRDGRNRWRVAEPSHNAPIASLPG